MLATGIDVILSRLPESPGMARVGAGGGRGCKMQMPESHHKTIKCNWNGVGSRPIISFFPAVESHIQSGGGGGTMNIQRTT